MGVALDLGDLSFAKTKQTYKKVNKIKTKNQSNHEGKNRQILTSVHSIKCLTSIESSKLSRSSEAWQVRRNHHNQEEPKGTRHHNVMWGPEWDPGTRKGFW